MKQAPEAVMASYTAPTARSRSLTALQECLDVFGEYYNTVRPHRAKNRRTPQAAFDARVKAAPAGLWIPNAGEFRIRCGPGK